MHNNFCLLLKKEGTRYNTRVAFCADIQKEDYVLYYSNSIMLWLKMEMLSPSYIYVCSYDLIHKLGRQRKSRCNMRAPIVDSIDPSIQNTFAVIFHDCQSNIHAKGLN